MVIENQKGMSTVYTTMGGTNAEIRCLAYSSGHLKVARAYGNDTWEVADSPSGTFTYKKIG